MKVFVTEDGQVTIPKDLRERLNITPGTVMEFHEDNGRLVGEKVTGADPITEVMGCLVLDAPADQILAEMRGRP